MRYKDPWGNTGIGLSATAKDYENQKQWHAVISHRSDPQIQRTTDHAEINLDPGKTNFLLQSRNIAGVGIRV